MKEIYRVIIRPLLTEKSTGLQERQNTYAFEVHEEANKIEIGTAVEQLFGVKVAGVRTLIVRGKTKRFGRRVGRRANWKKAYVTLAGEETIDLLASV